jgi:hypothetical protein
MKISYLLCSLVVVCALQYGCKKTEENVPYNPAPQEMKDYLWFDTGSYWVYEDSATNQLDSIVISSTQETTVEDRNNGKHYADYQFLRVNATSITTGSTYSFYMTGVVDYQQKAIVIQYENPQMATHIWTSYVLIHPQVINKNTEGVVGKVILKDTLPVYNLNGVDYKNVKLYYQEADGIMLYDSSLTWIAPGFGIIKKQNLAKPQTYWLKRSKLISK